jgi:GTP-binding protein HflX
VASFKATLAEAIHADLLLHVVDAADPGAAGRITAVNAVLEEIGVRDKPTIVVLNQCDRVEDPALLIGLERLHPATVRVSAHTGLGIDRLAEEVGRMLAPIRAVAEVRAHAGNGKLLAHLSAAAQILDQEYVGDEVVLRVSAPRRMLDRLPGFGASLRYEAAPPVESLLPPESAASVA